MSRFVIIAAAGGYYSGNTVLRMQPVPRVGDPAFNDLVQIFKPDFDAPRVDGALKFNTEDDARAATAHPHLEDRKAFEGCTIRQTEFDTDEMSAVRDVGAVIP